MEWTGERVREIQRLAYETDCVSLNTIVSDNEEKTDCELGDFIVDTRNPFDEVENKITKEVLLNLIHELKEPRMEYVLINRFGLLTGEFLTLEEIAKKHNVSRERIRQVESKALLRLRKIILRKNLKFEDFIGG